MKTQANQTPQADVRPFVRQRYGKYAEDFQPEAGSGCCGSGEGDDSAMVPRLYEASDIEKLPAEVTGLSMGCGDPITLASLNPGQTVLDLGSGGGIDCFLAAKRVGATGHVIGVDMTPEMVERARSNKASLGADNVEFRLGEIEHLPVSDETVDVIISNCVINLSPDKPQVFREAFRVLKPGGRLAVSDIVTDGPLPQIIRENINAWAGCIAGALDVQDYLAAIRAAGFEDVQLTPVYWDPAMIAEAGEGLELQLEEKGGCCQLVINDGTGVEVVELEAPPDIDGEQLQKTIFSAKITARKPEVMRT